MLSLKEFLHFLQAPRYALSQVDCGRCHDALFDQGLDLPGVAQVDLIQQLPGEPLLGMRPESFDGVVLAAVRCIEQQGDPQLCGLLTHSQRVVDRQVVQE